MQTLDASLVSISLQTPDNSLSMAEKNELAFEVLSDVGNKVARRFGLVFSLGAALRPLYKAMGVDLPARNGDNSYELPIPGTFVVARNGTIRLAFVDADYTRRLEPAAILDCLQAISIRT